MHAVQFQQYSFRRYSLRRCVTAKQGIRARELCNVVNDGLWWGHTLTALTIYPAHSRLTPQCIPYIL